MAKGYLYELGLAEPARFRARGLDSAHRVAQRINDAVLAALEADPEVLEVEDRAYLHERAQPCDGTARCRAALHNRGCEAWHG